MNEKFDYSLTSSDKFVLILIGGIFIFILVIGSIIKPENVHGAVVLFIYTASVISSGIITRKLTLLELTDEFFERIRNDIPEDVITELKNLRYLSRSEERLTRALNGIIGEDQTSNYKDLISEHVAKLLDNKYSRPKRQMLIWIRRLLWGISIASGLIMLWMWLFYGSKVFRIP